MNGTLKVSFKWFDEFGMPIKAGSVTLSNVDIDELDKRCVDAEEFIMKQLHSRERIHFKHTFTF